MLKFNFDVKAHRFIKHIINPFALLLLTIILITFLFWPGFLSSDSIYQLQQAINGNYSDHHPPLMAMYWSLFLWLKVGPEPMLITNQMLLLISSYNIIKSMGNRRLLSCLVPLIVIFPHVSAYSGAVLKDVMFGLCYLCGSSFLIKNNLTENKLNLYEFFIIFLVILFGTSVKYQSIFVLPFFSLWFGFTQYKNIYKAILLALLFFTMILGSKYLITNSRSEKVNPSHSWQLVKLYDLAGISLKADKELFPEFIINNSNYSFTYVKNNYSNNRVDELLGWNSTTQGPLFPGKNSQERNMILKYWQNSVRSYPLFYLQHRFSLWFNIFEKTPIKSLDEIIGKNNLPNSIFNIINFIDSNIILKTMYEILKECTKFKYYLILIILYLIIALKFRYDPAALPLLFMMLCSISLMASLFVFSMASDFRYIYMSVIMLHFSHPVALNLFLRKRFFGNKLKENLVNF